MFYVGADGCKGGWFAVRLGEGGVWEASLFPSIIKLWERYKDAKLILLDIPIGLPDEGPDERSCDKEARKLLCKRRSSVFSVPCRSAVYADTYEMASKNNEQKTGRRLSKQSWGIVSKIKEVDQLLSIDMSARSHIREVHPELCFWALNHGKPMQYSKTKKGEQAFSERTLVLGNLYPCTEKIVDFALQKYRRYEVARDDILDALVAAVTAYKGEQGLTSIPENRQRDSRGLPMEMVYWPPY